MLSERGRNLWFIYIDLLIWCYHIIYTYMHVVWMVPHAYTIYRQLPRTLVVSHIQVQFVWTSNRGISLVVFVSGVGINICFKNWNRFKYHKTVTYLPTVLRVCSEIPMFNCCGNVKSGTACTCVGYVFFRFCKKRTFNSYCIRTKGNTASPQYFCMKNFCILRASHEISVIRTIGRISIRE